MSARAAHAHDEVHLLGGTVVHGEGQPGSTGREPRRRLPAGPTCETGIDLGRQALVVDVAGGGDDEIAGPVVVVEEAADLDLVQRLHARRGAEDLAAQGVLGEHRRRALLRREVRRLVGVHQDLVQDDLAFGVDVVHPQRGLGHDGAQHVEAEREVVGQ
jgi:hypothetical protein